MPAAPMQLVLLWVGKTRNPHLRSLCDDYLERTRRLVRCEVVEIRDPGKGRALKGPDLRNAEAREIAHRIREGSRVVVLEAGGREFTSVELSRWFEAERLHGTRELAFVVGGPEGLGDAVRARAFMAFSLGKMTWTHEMVRVLLLEQIYRAFAILGRIPYHK